MYYKNLTLYQKCLLHGICYQQQFLIILEKANKNGEKVFVFKPKINMKMSFMIRSVFSSAQ